MTRIGIVAAVIIIVVASVFFGFRKAAREHADDDETPPASASPTMSSPSTSSSPSKSRAAGTPLEHPRAVRRIDPESRKLLLAEIAAARARREKTNTVPPGAPPAPPATQELTKEYIGTQIRELIPLLEECYTKALEDDPKLGGRLLVKFAIGGEPDVGGLVEESEVDPAGSTIQHAGMNECVRETMFAAEFVAPPEGARVKVHYGFEFTSERRD